MVDCMSKWSFGDLRDLTKKNQRFFKISFSNGEIGYRVLGNGIKKIIVFYGFGQAAEDYYRMADAHPDYTFYILDLPFHGATIIKTPSKPISQQEIVSIIKSIKRTESIRQFSLMGCSIGAKLAFQVIGKYAKDLEGVILIAPDGIHNNLWYRLATQTAAGRTLFRSILGSEQLLRKLISLAKKFRIIDQKTASFAIKSTNDRERRMRVFNTWCYLRNLRLNANVSRVLNELSIKTTFVVGTKDKVIPVSAITRLSSKLKEYNVVEIEAGHHNLINRYAEKLLDETTVNR